MALDKNAKTLPTADVTMSIAKRAELAEVRTMLFHIIDEITIYNESAKDYEREHYTIEYLNSLLDEDPSSILIARTGNDASGFLITKPDNGPIWLCWFGVTLEARGKGIGSLLITKMIELASDRKIHKIWCDTRTNNRYSVPILEAHGFQKMCRLDNHWCHQDYFLWQKFIGGTDQGRERD